VSDERKRQILDRAVEDKDLLAAVPPIIAYAFGIVPIRREGTILTIACFGHSNRDALRLLREVLGHEIVASPFDERPLHTAIAKAYPGNEGEAINFPTFESPDFLTRPGAAAALRETKVERLGKTGSELPAETVVLASITYRGRLSNLEHPRKGAALPDLRNTKYELRDEDLAWTLEGGRPVLQGAAPAKEPPILYLNEFRFADHRNYSPGSLFAQHSARGLAIAAPALPHVVHPTEVQLTRIEPDGALVFHVYSREERVSPGEPARVLSCGYYFLSFGQRLRREIDLTVHEVLAVSRSQLSERKGRACWSCRELERWFT
jgi:hypothetical protein